MHQERKQRSVTDFFGLIAVIATIIVFLVTPLAAGLFTFPSSFSFIFNGE